MYKAEIYNDPEFAKVYMSKRRGVDNAFNLIGKQTMYHTDYGKSKIPDNNDEFAILLREHFDVFVDLQKIANIVTGCGSYCFDGQSCLDYYPEQYPKQKLLFDYSKGKKNVLELGVYCSHSAWLMILANLDNPDFHYTGIDICYFDFTEKSIEYL